MPGDECAQPANQQKHQPKAAPPQSWSDHRSDGETGHRVNVLARVFANCTIKPERKRETQRNKRKLTVCDSADEHAYCRDAHGEPLGPTQLLLTKNHADQDSDERVNEVPERGSQECDR